MKVSQQKKAFVPITITLETKEELEMMGNSMRVGRDETLNKAADEKGFSAYDVDGFEGCLYEELDELNQ